MFDNLSDKLQRVFKNLRGEGKLTAANMEAALREIRVALLEADVNFKVVRDFTDAVVEKAIGEHVIQSLKPGEVDSTERKVVSVDVVGDAAVAKLELKRPNAVLTDYMSLLKVDGRWLIVNKIFTRDMREHVSGS